MLDEGWMVLDKGWTGVRGGFDIVRRRLDGCSSVN